MFQKPQAQDAGSANATDASSPFQLLLNSSVTAPPATDQGGQDTSDSGTNSGKDSKSDGKSAHAQQSGANQVIADSSSLIQAIAASDGSQNNDAQANPGGDNAPAPTDDQIDDPSTLQARANAAQSLAAAALPDRDNGNIDKTDNASAKPDATAAADALAARTNSDAQNGTAVNEDSSGGADDTRSSASASSGNTSSSVSSSTPASTKSAKTKGEGQALAPVQQPADASVQANSPPQASAPAAKKDHKADKTRDPKNSDAFLNQALAVPPVTGVAASAPAPAAVDAASSVSDATEDAIAALQAGQGKSAAKNNQAAPNPPGGGKTPASSNPASSNPASNNQAAGDAAKPEPGAQASPETASSGPKDNSVLPDGKAMPGTDAKSTNTADDKSGQQTASAPAQPQAPQQPPQVQAAVPAVQAPAQLQAHAGQAAAVTQNVQVSPSDTGANANTVGALAVAIAAKSQSGNKQFDIRLDPPELGRVEVRLSIDATGKAQASLSADQPRTLDLLKTDAPTLTRALRDAGLNVSQNGLNFSLRGQNQQNGNSNGFAPRSGRAAQISLIATSAIGSVPGGAHYQGPADGRLDIRV